MLKTMSPPKRIKNLLIRFATPDDLPQIAQVAQITWEATYQDIIDLDNQRTLLRRAYQPDNLLSVIDAPGNWFYVAEIPGNRLIAFAHFMRRYHPLEGRAELVHFYVLPAYQNKGVGRSMLITGFQALAEANISQCFVSVQSGNLRAQNIYEKHGFVYHRKHGQFLGTQIITLVQYIRPITKADMINEPNY